MQTTTHRELRKVAHPFSGLAAKLAALATAVLVPLGAQAGGVTPNDAPSAPALVYVDFQYASLPAGTSVNWPYTASGSYTVGTDAFATIQEAITQVASGGTVKVAPGTYAEHLLVSKPVTLQGTRKGQDAKARFAAFISSANGPKAVDTLESIITAAAASPDSAANDTLHIMADDVTVDGFVFDGNNAALVDQTLAQKVGGINTDAGRAIVTADAAGNLVGANRVLVQNNIIQNFSQRGVELANPTNTSLATVGSLVTSNYVRNFGLAGIYLAYNAYCDITHNTVDMVYPAEAGLELQDFETKGSASTLDWSFNTVTVSQEAFGGIWANYVRLSGLTLNIHDNTVNAAEDVTTGISEYETLGIYLSTLTDGVSAQVANNTVGASGGQFDRGIALWNLPTTGQVTVSGGTVSHALKGVSVHYLDPNFGVDFGGTTQVTVSGVSLSGTDVGVFVEAFGAAPDSIRAAITGCSITHNWAGVQVYAANALLQGNDLSANSEAGILVQSNGKVDAGDYTAGDSTGLGSSRGQNKLTGYGFDNAGPWAIENLNSTQPVLADGNDFGALAGQSVASLIRSPNTSVRTLEPPTVRLAGLANGQATVVVQWVTGYHVTVQASANLLDWADIGSGTIPTAPASCTIIDDNAASFSHRFYRAVYRPAK